MTELVEQLKAISAKIDKSAEATHAAQEKLKELDTKTGETDSTVKEAVAQATKAFQEAQDLKLKVDAVGKTVEYIEKSVSRMGATGGSSESEELEAKAKDEMTGYLRNRTPLSDEVIKATTLALTQKSLHGVTDAERELYQKTLIAGSNPDGGYWIRPERSAKMIQRIFETSPVRQLADIQTTSSDSMEFIIDDDEAASGGWVDLLTALPSTKFQTSTVAG